MRCFDVSRWRRACASLLSLGSTLLLLAAAPPAQAHKSSDAYLQIDARAGLTTLRWDIALRDLDAAIDIDRDDDGRITWGEVRAAWPRIDAYALPRLRIDGCPLKATGHALERRSDGAYAVIELSSPCTLARQPVIRYGLMREIDPTHRGIARIDRDDGKDGRHGRPTEVLLLDPAHFTGAAATPSAWDFLRQGMAHILGGYDHILFLLCLLLPAVLRRTPQGIAPVPRLVEAVVPVAGIVSAFTVAHTLTLGLAAMHWVALPPGIIEPAIAATIIITAIDNLHPVLPLPRAGAAFAFGLVHGFGFAGALSELDLPTGLFVRALLEFNVGLELGQLAIVAVAVTLLYALRGRRGYRRWVVGAGSGAAIAIASVWFVVRVAGALAA
ncbi:MAG: HupE/UreJ family protein [Burkholderiales bacterium]|nr:HupE/UreJ family protein [Burkholderiales bacterium]